MNTTETAIAQMPEKRITIEDILGDFGFRVRWSVLDYWADVEVFEIAGRGVDPDCPLFALKGKPNEILEIEIDDAEPYLEGFVKWDGCAELNQGQPHWCGPEVYKNHIELLKYIYRRAFELMGREPEEKWED